MAWVTILVRHRYRGIDGAGGDESVAAPVVVLSGAALVRRYAVLVRLDGMGAISQLVFVLDMRRFFHVFLVFTL